MSDPPTAGFGPIAREEFGRLVEALSRLRPESAQDVLDGLEQAGATDQLMSVLRASVSDLKAQSKDVEGLTSAGASRSGALAALKTMLASEQLSDEDRQRVELVTMALVDVVWSLMGEPETPHDIAATLFGALGKLDAAGVRPDMTADELLRKLRQLFGSAPDKRRRTQPELPLPDYLPFTADRVQQGMLEAVCRIHEMRPAQDIRDRVNRSIEFAHAFEWKTDSFRMLIGYARPAADLVDALAEHDTLALKLIPVLWARWFEQTGGDPGQWARMAFAQLCQDLCLTRNKGAFKRQHKVDVADVYDAVMSLQVYAECAMRGEKYILPPGRLWDTKEAIVKSPKTGISSDLFWRPGPIFADQLWRQQNPYLGHVSRQLLQLDRRRKWAIRLGADYAMLARLRHDHPDFRARREVTDRVRYILQRTGLDQAMAGRPAMQERSFEAAHDELVEVGILVDHRYGNRPAAEWSNRDKVLCFPRDLAVLPAQLGLRLGA